MQNQVYIFIAFILNGFLIGIIFDCFRILRRSFKTPDFVTYIEDILFGIITGLLILYSIFKFNNGEIRFYLFLGIFFGLLLYFLIFSRVFIKISITIICIVKKTIDIVVITPIKFICKLIKKIFFKPIVFICISLKKTHKKVFHFFVSKIYSKYKIPKTKYHLLQKSTIKFKNKKDLG